MRIVRRAGVCAPSHMLWAAGLNDRLEGAARRTKWIGKQVVR